MIRVVMRPRKAPVVAGEGLYLAEANGLPLCFVRARNAACAEDKLMYLLLRETPGKTLDFKLEGERYEEQKTQALAAAARLPQRDAKV